MVLAKSDTKVEENLRKPPFMLKDGGIIKTKVKLNCRCHWISLGK